ncbi:uncharacterized protein Z518_00198 [Rhinocladiella mackenziei CBS 650.93]|uniref:Rhinocladiella mackenziei CBS 650.93 unplaced genomic scaffold supercont1.1, whole genome shotgun sequence n=1 Tax=Rhinocladiella mackenziei CBS 650.93 TaxID=1442369 RepID=A0A0D2JIA9_9EURO|nr:uncharacterized protein Z518_00198 [Rhinocladiella mackenziei CBS 650.93]KIX09120.1 hypothetical protein Z518_00198 [Rhinocladiella mackenziei CBS 650.93]
MDFLSIPKNCERQTIEIPCLSTQDYDDGDFDGYPDRAGWGKRSSHEWHSIFKNPSTNFLAFLQTWLLFGPLALTFRTHISLGAFTKNGLSGQLAIDTSRLTDWVSRKPTFRPQTAEEGRRARDAIVKAARLHSDLHVVHTISDYPERQPSLQEFIQTTCLRDPRDQTTILATATLLEFLFEYCFFEDVRHLYPKMKGAFGGHSLTEGGNNLLWWKMRKNGWCPFELAVLSKRLNTAGLYFMYHMVRPKPSQHHKVIRIHPIRSSPQSVDNSTALTPDTSSDTSKDLCTMTQCSFLQLNDESYKTKHADGCDPTCCYDMTANPQDVLDILRGGSIPLILSIDAEDKDNALTLVSSGPNFEYSYVAISHVWSDGMGNVQRSALPRCQILRLSKLIRNLPGKSSGILLFWIDTIGCPPDVAGQNEAQELAIKMMRETYENATAVLVLDSWLQTLKLHSIPDHEILMAIICSAWNSRLWTLQEGALAQELLFQFSDGAYNIDQGLLALHESQDSIVGLTLRTTIFDKAYEIRDFRKIEDAIGPKLTAIKAALSQRSTSVQTDEALCLAALLNLSKATLTMITQAPPKDRMRVFWSQLKEVPLEIIFGIYPRLDMHGYRWAPRSFLRHPENVGVSGSLERAAKAGLATRTNTGLRFRCAGLVMATATKPIGSFLWTRDDDDIYYLLHPHFGDLDRTTERDVTYKYSDSWPAEYDFKDTIGDECTYETTMDLYGQHGTQILCFLFQLDIREGSVTHREGATKGVFASMELKFSGVMHVKYLFPGTAAIFRDGVNNGILGQIPRVPVQRATRIHDQSGDITLPLGVACDRDGILRIAGARMFSEQEWCLS